MYLIIVNCKININKFKCVYLKFFWWFICLFLALVSRYVMLDGAANRLHAEQMNALFVFIIVSNV